MSIKGRPMLWFEKWLTYITGETFSSGHLQEIGARIFNLERMYNLREGFTRQGRYAAATHAARAVVQGYAVGPPAAISCLPRYYKNRGWSRRRRADEADAGDGCR